VAGVEPVGGAFVRLLDGSGEFTAEVVSSASGAFRFFAAPAPGRYGPCTAAATARPASRRTRRACTTRSEGGTVRP
jgi:hypothetical protein